MYKTRNILYNSVVEKEIPISEVRERLLSLVDDLPREGVIVTRHGNPIARLMPVRTATADLIGSLKGIVTVPPLRTGHRPDRSIAYRRTQAGPHGHGGPDWFAKGHSHRSGR